MSSKKKPSKPAPKPKPKPKPKPSKGYRPTDSGPTGKDVEINQGNPTRRTVVRV